MEIADKREIDYSILARIGLEPLTFDKGEHILSQGDVGDEMFLLREGCAAIVVNNSQLEVIGAGGIFGEMGLVDGAPRSASVVALEPCQVVPVSERTFLYLVHETPYFALDVMRTLAGRVRRMNDKVLTL